MTLPILAKTWQFQVNQTIPAQGSLLATMRRVIRTLKDLYKSFGLMPWTVSGSSNAVAAAMDGVDRWAVDTDLVWNTAGLAHSWIVLRQIGIAVNFEVCIDLSNSSSPIGSIIVSPSVGFAGGSTIARPTAADEMVVLNNVILTSANDSQFQIHGFQSTDGECTRFSIWRLGTNNATFSLFDKPQNPVPGWVNPSVSFWASSSSAIAATYAFLGTISAAANGRGRGVSTMNIGMTGEGGAAGAGFLAENATIGSVANQLSNEWMMPPIGIVSQTALNIGRHGNLFDLWWRPLGVNDADTFPNNPLTRQFAALGNLIFPWTGDATIPLLT